MVLVEDKGIESIPLRLGKSLGLESEHPSAFLCSVQVDFFAKKNLELARSSIRVRESYVLDACEILSVYMIRWCYSGMMISSPCSPVERRIPG
jgi:hypothetical protein